MQNKNWLAGFAVAMLMVATQGYALVEKCKDHLSHNRAPGPIVHPMVRAHFVVVGVGDIVMRGYGPAFDRIIEEYAPRGHDVRVTYLDASEFWASNPNMVQKMKGIQNQIRLNGHYIDQSRHSDETREQLLSQLKPDVLIIATPDSTHVDIAMQWLSRAERTSHWPQVFIEKPLDSQLEKAKQLSERLQSLPQQVWAFDHFRARFSPTPEQLHSIRAHVGPLESVFFGLLENRSGSDLQFQRPFDRDGAIESEGREKALHNGLILDLLSHMPPVLKYFGAIDSIRPMWVRAAKYMGVDEDPNKLAQIWGETFADVGFEFLDENQRRVSGRGAIGKGVAGVRRLGARFEREATFLELVGSNKNRAVVNLHSSRPEVVFFNAEGSEVPGGFALPKSAYFAFLKQIMDGTYVQNSVAMTTQEGHLTLQLLNQIRQPILRLLTAGAQLPTYPGGMKNGRQAPALEELDYLPVFDLNHRSD